MNPENRDDEKEYTWCKAKEKLPGLASFEPGEEYKGIRYSIETWEDYLKEYEGDGRWSGPKKEAVEEAAEKYAEEYGLDKNALIRGFIARERAKEEYEPEEVDDEMENASMLLIEDMVGEGIGESVYLTMSPPKIEFEREGGGKPSPEETGLRLKEAKEFLPELEEYPSPTYPNMLYTLDEWREYMSSFSEECGWDVARKFLPNLDEYLERTESEMTLDRWREHLKRAINTRKILEGEKDWCTEHGRMLLYIDGRIVCPECREAAEDDEAKLRELSRNWITRRLGDWRCKKHGKDLELNAHNELVCPDCVDEMIIEGTSPEEIDKRHVRKPAEERTL